MRFLTYSLARIIIIFLVAIALYWLGMRSWLLWMSAVIIGALISYIALGTQRDQAARQLREWDPLRDRPDSAPEHSEDTESEDSELEQRLASEETAYESGSAARLAKPDEGGADADPDAPDANPDA